ncbi:stage II sporulation protein M [Bacillus cereus]|uniref:stage II sporulation protein M n=1 Tax=Bacillus cereus TaxID=1396 RepID=UPI003980A6F2
MFLFKSIIRIFKQSKWEFLIISMFLTTSIVIGYLNSDIQNITQKKPEIDKSIDFITLLIHNLKVCIWILLGWITFGISTLFTLIFNGLTIGSIISNSIHSFGIYNTFILIVPHASIEILGILCASALGLQPLVIIYQFMNGQKNNLKFILSKSINLFLLSLFFFLIASIIEAYITPLFYT